MTPTRREIKSTLDWLQLKVDILVDEFDNLDMQTIAKRTDEINALASGLHEKALGRDV